MINRKNGFNGKKTLLAAAILAPLVLVAGCSDSGNLPFPTAGGGAAASFAYDGYLRNATVCADLNQNKSCDAGEPTTETVAAGKFTFNPALTAAQNLAPLALEAKTGTGGTVDEDTGNLVDFDFTYVAPGGSVAVSAFSTIIQIDVESRLAADSNLSVADALSAAKAQLANDLGATTGKDLLEYDPIAVANEITNSDSNLAAKLHLINQVFTQNINTALSSISSSSNASPSAKLYAAIQKVSAQRAAIKTAIDSATLSGTSPQELTAAQLKVIVDNAKSASGDQDLQISPADLTAAANEIQQAQAIIKDAIDAETGGTSPDPDAPSGATGGTGASGGGTGSGQGTS